MIDPEYYTVAHGDGQTTASAEADVDVGSHTICRAARRTRSTPD